MPEHDERDICEACGSVIRWDGPTQTWREPADNWPVCRVEAGVNIGHSPRGPLDLPESLARTDVEAWLDS